MPYRKILAHNLIAFRESENISQQEISFRTAVSKDTISLIEREQTNVRLDILEKIASYTGLTISELFTEDYVKNMYAQKTRMNKYILKMFFRIALYRKALNVKEARIIGDDNLFPVCPRCVCTMNREYQSFCDRCGQKLKWKDFSKVKIVEAET